VANRTRPIYEAARLAAWQLAETGRELRLARIRSGMLQADVARALATSTARISMIERGLVPTVAYRDLARFAGVVGLKLYLRAYPAGRRLLDAPQLQLLDRFRSRVAADASLRTEVLMPLAGDLRAADCLVTLAGITILVELITRLADFQAQSRAALLKQRDLGADRCLLVLAATRANRTALREADAAADASFPLRTREVLRALAAGHDPGGNGIVLL
jgi:transcriptional regulator with XRE-family HTH domain